MRHQPGVTLLSTFNSIVHTLGWLRIPDIDERNGPTFAGDLQQAVLQLDVVGFIYSVGVPKNRSDTKSTCRVPSRVFAQEFRSGKDAPGQDPYNAL